MIGHYLLTLTPVQEDRVLTGKMSKMPCYVDQSGSCGCLKGVVHNYNLEDAQNDPVGRGQISLRGVGGSGWGDVVGMTYDVLCDRFGVERVNRAIRNRILSNRARRALTQPSFQEA